MPHTFGFDSVAGGGGGGGGITDLNGLVVATQSFAVGNAGVDFNIISASPTHTFNLPDASATTRGALTSADWTTFNGKLSTAILSINGMTGTAQTINSGSTGTDLNIASVGNVTTINIPDASTTARGLVTTGTQTFGGAKTFTQNSASALVSNGTYTTLASGVAHAVINPNMTLATIFQGSAVALNISPTMVATANQQFFVGLNIAGTYTGFGSGSNVSRLIPINADGIFIAGGRTSTILLGTAGAGVIPSGFGAIHIGFDVGGGNSILIGRQAGLNGGSGGSILIGGRAGFQAGNGLIGIGGDVAFNVSTPTSSIIIGGGACQFNSSGANATFFTNGVMIGAGARSFNNTDNNAVVIGTLAFGQGSNSVVIGDNNITRTFLKGDTAIGYAPTTATITPNGRVDILGSSAISGNALIVSNSTPTEIFKITNTGSVIINESGSIFGGGQGFRVETDLNTHALYVDYSSNLVGINNASPSFTLDIGGNCASALFSTYGQMELQDGTGAFLSVGSTEFIAFNDGGFITFGSFGGSKIGTASSQQFAFWGQTPVAQPTTGVASATRVGVASTNIQTSDTFDGYTMAQVVGALRRIGLLA